MSAASQASIQATGWVEGRIGLSVRGLVSECSGGKLRWVMDDLTFASAHLPHPWSPSWRLPAWICQWLLGLWPMDSFTGDEWAGGESGKLCYRHPPCQGCRPHPSKPPLLLGSPLHTQLPLQDAGHSRVTPWGPVSSLICF